MCELHPNYAYPRYGYPKFYPDTPIPGSLPPSPQQIYPAFKVTKQTLILLMKDNSISIRDLLEACVLSEDITPTKFNKIMEILNGK